MSSGFTLIELMVVVVLVMILALAIVPTFRDIINKAKYTEGSAAISALRTNIKVFYTDNTRLPGLDATFAGSLTTTNGCHPLDSTGAVDIYTVATSADLVQTLCSRSDEQWLINGVDASSAAAFSRITNGVVVVGTNTVTGVSPLQRDLNITFGDYAGAYFKNSDYQYLIINGGKGSSSYGYAIAVTASGAGRSPAIGTGYAVLEVYNPSWYLDQLLTGTWESYSPQNGTKAQLYLQLVANVNSYVTTANVIPVPRWSLLAPTTSNTLYEAAATNTAGATVSVPNKGALTTNLGWKFL